MPDLAFMQAQAFTDANIVDVSSYQELKDAVVERKWARGPWAGQALPTQLLLTATRALYMSTISKGRLLPCHHLLRFVFLQAACDNSVLKEDCNIAWYCMYCNIVKSLHVGVPCKSFRCKC